MAKSPIDELFNELYGYYPNKAGQAYELIVAAAFKAITNEKIEYDKHERGIYSETDYQIDAVITSENEKKMVEAKDYTLNDRKVGRSDLQKMQGALSDLQFEKGFFASATDYTKPAKKYSDSSEKNPLQKEIDLYHIRPSTELDEKGRISKFVVDLTAVIPKFEKGEFQCAWTKNAEKELENDKLIGSDLKYKLDRFYKENGELDCFISEFSYNNQPILANIDDEFALGCWLLPNKYIKIGNKLYGINGIAYKIPYSRSTTTFTIESDGIPRVLIKSEDGKINKLITDENLKKAIFKNGIIE